jgi:M6 family metalloprotease-like protein
MSPTSKTLMCFVLAFTALLLAPQAVVGQPNLTPYQPSGWSDKIVVSKVTGTNTDGTGLTTADTLYVDWAVINSGTSATAARFYTQLYVDNVLQGNSWYSDPPLNANFYASVLDYSIGTLSAGTHTLRIVTDSTGTITESNESDNQYTKTITVTATGQPNLTPYQPSGWSDKIVVSKVTGTNTDGTGLTTADTLYVDWAVSNSGTAATAARFYTQLYVDNVLQGNSWYSDPPLNANFYASVLDYSIGTLSAGTHTLRIVTDSTGTIAESNESDNQYTKTITVTATGQPNLTPYQPSGWSDKIVVSKVTGTNTDSAGLTTADTLYVDWAVSNSGTAATAARFYTQLYVDNVLQGNSWYSDPPLNAGFYISTLDYSIGTLSAGTHTLRIVTDSTGTIAESNESDNQYTKTITVTAVGQPNLTPYQPSGWSDKIVVSKVTGTNTDSTGLTTGDALYVDWAVINSGTAATAARFYTQLYVDDVLQNTSWYTDPPLNAGYYTTALDYSIGSLSAGTHTIKIITDSTGTIAESNESDNQYIKTITVTAAAAQPNLTPYQPSGWSDKIVVSKVTGTSTDSTGLTTGDTLYVDWAVINSGTAATDVRFYTHIYVDNVLQDISWYSDPPLNAGFYVSALDYSIGTLSAGTHTIKIVTDSTGVIAESNESDNQYTKTITVTAAAAQPNLTPYQPSGWSDMIVVSKVTGTNTDSIGLTTADTLYVDWSVINSGTVATAARFYTQLYVDNVLQGTSWYTDPPMNAGFYTTLLDYSIGTLSAGTHTIKIVTDSTGVIAESSESDNQYTKTITVGSSSTLAVDSISTTPQQPIGGQQFVFTIAGSGFDTSTAEVFFVGPGCATTTSCVVSHSALNTKTATVLAGPATLTDGAFTVQARNTSNGAVSNSKTLIVAKQGSTSSARALVLLVDFPDKPSQASRDFFQALLFGDHPSQAPQGTFRDYYKEVSYGALDVDGSVNNATIAWIRLPHDSTYYAGGCFGINKPEYGCSATYPQNSQKMVEDAVTTAQSLGMDFGPFDANQDGYVDSLFVIHAGSGGEFTQNKGEIWSHAWVTTSPIDTGSTNSAGNKVYVYRYTTEPEYMSVSGDMTFGVFAHEFGHIHWGLPDLYDIDSSSYGIGDWSLMAGGSWNGFPQGSSPAHLDAWSKFFVGFVTPTKVTSTLSNQSIKQAATAGDVYQLLSGSAPSHAGEYFLVENRERAGFDSGLPSSGLLIWHIDESQSSNSPENYPGCTVCSGHYHVQLVQADNRWDLEKKANPGDAGDPFPGVCVTGLCNASFTDSTSPNSKLWSGQPSGVSVTSISAPASLMTATLTTAAPAVTIEQAAGQADPTSTSPINFTVTFTESVTGFAGSGVSIGGTAGATIADVTGSGANYNVAVSGMTHSGTVIATIPAGVATGNVSGAVNLASTSTDNVVTYSSAAPTVAINQASAQADPTSVQPVNFTVQFSEAVIWFTSSGVNITGTAPFASRSIVVTGSGATYNVAVSGMSGSGTVIATVSAGVAQGTVSGLQNQASSSTDNVITFTSGQQKRRGQLVSD